MEKTNVGVKKSIIVLLKLYHNLVSPFLGNHCRFSPTCSIYAQVAVERHGVVCGLWLSFKRLLKCHPWYKKAGYDPVPEEIKNNR